MSIEHRTSEAVKGDVNDDILVKIDGSRIVGVKGPTFISQFYAPILRNRRQLAEIFAAQMIERIERGEVTMERVFELADQWVIAERKTAKDTAPMYFKLYMETDQSTEEVLDALEHSYQL